MSESKLKRFPFVPVPWDVNSGDFTSPDGFVSKDDDEIKKQSDKEELLKFLMDIRAIRVEHKEIYSRRINALNPLVGDYSEKIGKLRSEFVRLTGKINLIDDIIDFVNDKP
jgi:hypothetical protein